MFTWKYGILFFSKNTIEWRVIDRSGVSLSHRSFDYTAETLSEVLVTVGALWQGNIRVILGEELVYVTELSIPGGKTLTRVVVLEEALQSIPEDLKQTGWDFERAHTIRRRGAEEFFRVQVVVVEKTFSEQLRVALRESGLVVESMISESYALSLMEADASRVTVIMRQRLGKVLFCAVEGQLVLSTRLEAGVATVERTRAFLAFLASHKGKKATHIFLCSDVPEEVVAEHAIFSTEGFEVLSRDPSVFVAASRQRHIFGADETVLNIDVSDGGEKNAWRRFFIFMRSWYYYVHG